MSITPSDENIVATTLRLGAAIGMVVFALQMFAASSVETALFRGFLAAAGVAVVATLLRAAFLYAHAAALREPPPDASSESDSG